MAKIDFDIVTAERIVFSAHVDVVIAPGSEGELAILPSHAPLLTTLAPGEVVVRDDGEETAMFVRSGFLEVNQNRVIVLADAAERAEEIDLQRAEEAKRRAKEMLQQRGPEVDLARAEAALQRALTRITIAQKRRKRKKEPPRVDGTQGVDREQQA
ncbi:MAG: F0F1 ATP synthase subunit epsilon [Chloroflexota bacterium]